MAAGSARAVVASIACHLPAGNSTSTATVAVDSCSCSSSSRLAPYDGSQPSTLKRIGCPAEPVPAVEGAMSLIML
jgi:hypothetical protein